MKKIATLITSVMLLATSTQLVAQGFYRYPQREPRAVVAGQRSGMTGAETGVFIGTAIAIAAIIIFQPHKGHQNHNTVHD